MIGRIFSFVGSVLHGYMSMSISSGQYGQYLDNNEFFEKVASDRSLKIECSIALDWLEQYGSFSEKVIRYLRQSIQ